MKLKLPSMKLPNFRRSGPPPRAPRPARECALSQAGVLDDYEDEGEPTTKLSSAFIVVLALHLVAVGGIYAFNGIKARRHAQEVLNTPAVAAPAKAPVVTEPVNDRAYATAATPAPAAAVHPPALAVRATSTPAPASAPRAHHVHAGDTLAKLATTYNVSASELAKLNSLKDNAPLHPGQTLTLPAKRTATADASAQRSTRRRRPSSPRATEVPARRLTPWEKATIRWRSPAGSGCRTMN